MNHIFKNDGRALMVAINHGLGMGPIRGIEDMDKLLNNICREPIDSLTIHKGIALRHTDKFAGRIPLILKGTNITRFYDPEEMPIASVDEAVAMGADAVALGLSLCSNLEKDIVTNIAKVIGQAEKAGMPVVTHSYPNGNLIDNTERYSVKNVGYATRMALELGVDIIKTYWTGDGKTFEEIVKIGAPAKVVISGGPRSDTLSECFSMTYQGIQAGASGVTYGRNIWQHEYPVAVIRGLAAIIHDGATVEQAMKIASDCAGVKLA
jgi:DhnA family fructose-bisphosphate aldolase class Ia